MKDINPGAANSYPNQFILYNNLLFFVAAGELWKTDGTEQGTMIVKDIYPGSEGSAPDRLTIMKAILYFSASDGVNGRELWRSDGTEAGTYMVRDIYPDSDIYIGPNNSNPLNFTVYNDVLYFAATTYANGSELWRSDGTYFGTYLVKDIYPGRGPGNPMGEGIVYNNQLYFTANSGRSAGYELWVTDGSSAGTRLFQTFDPEMLYTDENVNKQAGDALYYRISIVGRSGGLTYSDTIRFVIRNKVRYGPNPVQKQLNVFLSLTERDDLAFIVYNQEGMSLSKRVYHLEPGDSMEIMNVENLPSGIYYLSIKGTTLLELIKFLKM